MGKFVVVSDHVKLWIGKHWIADIMELKFVPKDKLPKRRMSTGAMELGLAPEGVLPNGRRVSATFIASNYTENTLGSGDQSEGLGASTESFSSSGFLLGVEVLWGSCEFYYNNQNEGKQKQEQEPEPQRQARLLKVYILLLFALLCFHLSDVRIVCLPHVL